MSKPSERVSLRPETNGPEITFHIRGEEPRLACLHQRHQSSDLETPDLELTLFLFISQSEKRGRRGGWRAGKELQKSLGFSPFSISHVVKWEHKGEMSHKTRAISRAF